MVFQVGTVGNSGTTLVPHLHSGAVRRFIALEKCVFDPRFTVWGFTDAGNRYWALPIEWQSVAHRLLMVVRMVMRMRMMRMLEVINLDMVMMMKTVTITKIMTGTPRILLAYPAGYQYGQYHHHDYLYPKYGWCITN